MKILYVEDSAAAVLVMRRRLSNFGHEVVLAKNGQEAVLMFRAVAPDLVLMDIEMPVMNGFEAASRIRAVEATQSWAWTPIIFLTASDTEENLITAIEAGGDDFIAKTVTEPVLHAKMKAMARIAALRQGLTVANQKLEALASSDGLTGLCNRRSMDNRVDVSFSDAVQLQQPFGLLMIDIDHFKKYNDHYGHLQGDDCLRSVAQAIEATVAIDNAQCGNDAAFAARYGGEEFAVVLPMASAERTAKVAHALVEAVHGISIAHEKNADWGRVTISVGGAHLPQASGSIANLFRAADACLYQAKERGRNRAELQQTPVGV
jgi:diguanylate cyclase (GGDEF)-like protein